MLAWMIGSSGEDAAGSQDGAASSLDRLGSETAAADMGTATESILSRIAAHVPELEEAGDLAELLPTTPETELEPEPAKVPNPSGVRQMLQFVGPSNITLHMTAENQALEMCKQLVDLDPSQMKKCDDQALVPFFVAGMNGKTELLPVIHEAAVRHFGPVEGPMYTIRFKWQKQGSVTLLHHAALNDFEDLTEWLCAHGAEIDVFSRSTNTSNPPFTPLMMACKHNCTRAACVLVNAGADVNVRVPDGNGGGDLTPLHISIQLGHTDLAAFLFSKGARNTCTFGCTKCRMHAKWMTRRLITMRENIQTRLAADEREAARRQEFEDVMRELSFVDFLAEMKKITGELDSSSSQQPGYAESEQQAGLHEPTDIVDALVTRGDGPPSSKKQQVRKKSKKGGKKKGRR